MPHEDGFHNQAEVNPYRSPRHFAAHPEWEPTNPPQIPFFWVVVWRGTTLGGGLFGALIMIPAAVSTAVTQSLNGQWFMLSVSAGISGLAIGVTLAIVPAALIAGLGRIVLGRHPDRPVRTAGLAGGLTGLLTTIPLTTIVLSVIPPTTGGLPWSGFSLIPLIAALVGGGTAAATVRSAVARHATTRR